MSAPTRHDDNSGEDGGRRVNDEPSADGRGLAEIRLLHVDDDPEFVEMVSAFLEREDDRFEVETATSPSEAHDRLAESEFDCVISDHDMPDSTGIEFLEAVRETHPDLPFVLFTGKGSEEIASKAIAAGVSDYLQKGSVDRYSLLANRVENLVAQYRAESELDRHVRQQQIIAELGQTALADEDLESLFDRAVEGVSEGLDTEYSKVLEYRPEHEDVLLRAGVGWREGLVGEATVGVGDDSQAGHTLRSEEPIVVTDLRTEERFRGPPLLTEHDVVSGVSVIIGSPDEPWGVLGTHTTERTVFTDDDVNFVQSVANVLATAIERMEARRRDRRQRVLFENSPDMIDVLDSDGRVVEVNRRFREELGYDEDEVLGRPIWEIDPLVDAEDVERLLSDFSRDERRKFESRYERRDGSSLPVEVHLLRLDIDGETRFLAISRDITERKAYQRRFEGALEASPDAVIVVDEEGMIRQANRHVPDVLGFTQEELEGRSVEELLRDEDREDHVRFRREYMASPEPRPMGRGLDLYALRKDGTEIPVEISLGPIEHDGETYVVATVSDVSDRKRRERELRRQNRRLEEFTSIVSHDLRNPLSVLAGRLELVRRECDSEHLGVIEESIERMDVLIEDLRRFAREGDVVDRVESIDLRSLVEECWRHVATADATLVAETERTVRADRGRLRQLMENLMRNSVEHGSADVTVTVGDLDDGFFLEDDGPGIPADSREQVLQWGYSTSGDSTGIGLAIVNQIADAHGWRIQITEGTRGGARFEITGVERADT
jgi:PAS domain S-box-containing protein